MERSEPKVVKPKMRGRKLTSAVHFQGALTQEAVKHPLFVFTVRPTVMPLAEIS
jgi:hypothetical protein